MEQVNILDLNFVAKSMDETAGAAAPSTFAIDNRISPKLIQTWILQAQIENDGSLAFQQGIANLQHLLALLTPERTALLTNYPNPFNPETWIPYQLSEPAEVTLRIYAVSGALVRTLNLGHQLAGLYHQRSRAAYWNGKNELGESVASSVYFYTLTAGDFTATRKNVDNEVSGRKQSRFGDRSYKFKEGKTCMKNWKHFIKTSFLLMFILGYQTAEAQQNLAQEAYLIFEKSCLDCHGPHGAFTERLVIESASQLIDTGAVVQGNPDASELYRRLHETDPAKRMPQGQPKLPAAAIETIGRWIQAGAPSWESQRDVNFITMDTMLDTIQKHVQSLPRFNRPFARYFTTTHLYNAGENSETLRAYQIALSKLVNSLSWGSEIIQPQPIDPRKTIFYIDLRHYQWDVGNDAWTQIEQEYPYSIEFDSETQAGLSKKLTDLRQEMDCEVPFVYVDWFLATASQPPLYHDILALPETDSELERKLGIDVTKNIQRDAGVRVWRAGLNNSRVSKNNRVVERHRSQQGAYWKSYDFAGNVGVQHIVDYPLNFRHDGGEIVFNLPNGLQAYYISNASGIRINEAPTTIVSNPEERDGIVRNGISCIGCHTEGMKTFKDDVREVFTKAPDGPAKVLVLRLYVKQSEMDGYVREDTERYRQALVATGGVFGGIEPVYRFYKAFEGPVDAAHAAAAVGLETEALLEQIRKKASLQRLGLRTLESESGNVKRDAWTSNFSEVVSALNSPDDIGPRPVVPVDDLRPSDLVSDS